MAASILCIAMHPTKKKLMVLLGKEQKYCEGSDFWSDFGGKKKKNETPEMCASREFHEETCAVVQFVKNEHMPRRNFEKISHYLDSKIYLMKKDYVVNSSKKYTTFICEIPFQSNVPKNFRDTLNSLKTLQKFSNFEHPCVKSPCILNKDYLEKEKIKWFDVDHLERAINHNNILSTYYDMSKQPKEILGTHFSKRLHAVIDFLKSYEKKFAKDHVEATNEKIDCFLSWRTIKSNRNGNCKHEPDFKNFRTRIRKISKRNKKYF